MNDIADILFEDDRWKSIGLEHLANKAFATVLLNLNLSLDWEVSVLACDDTKIANLNDEFRKKSKATNVLSWPSYDLKAKSIGGVPGTPNVNEIYDNLLGDIAISFDTCEYEANAAHIALVDHTAHLLVHGCLHLLGYDHENDADAQLMEELESRLLKGMGITDPYENKQTDRCNFGKN